jgi:bacteriocin-like protein
MRHPFELEISDLETINFNVEELNDEETAKISGGLLTRGLWEAGGCHRPIKPPIKPIKPPIYTTLALGEEGGCGTRPKPKY